MDTLHNDVFGAISAVSRLSTDLVVLEAIWLDKPIQTSYRLTKRITKGDMIRIADGELKDVMPDYPDRSYPATHLILECKGTIYSGDLQVVCENLDTQEIITVKL